MKALVLILTCAVTSLVSPAVAQPCRLALVLALDVSGSVNETEYADQLQGLASALDAPAVRQLLLLEGEAPVHLLVYEWSSQNHQMLIQPWRAIDGPMALNDVIRTVRTYQRRRAGLKTAIGTSLAYAAALLAEKSNCWKKTIDVSGDGKNNIGPTPREIYTLPGFVGVTVNALVIGDPSPDLASDKEPTLTRLDIANYYQSEVIHGPGAFSMVAYGYPDYARAMEQKLLRELELPVLGFLQE